MNMLFAREERLVLAVTYGAVQGMKDKLDDVAQAGESLIRLHNAQTGKPEVRIGMIPVS